MLSWCTIGDENSCEGDRCLRREQGAGAGAAVAEAASRSKGRQPMRAPQPVRRRRSAGTNSPVDCWKKRNGEQIRQREILKLLPFAR